MYVKQSRLGCSTYWRSTKGLESTTLITPRTVIIGDTLMLLSDAPDCSKSVRVIGFCDTYTSGKAYAVVVYMYLRIQGETQACVRFVLPKLMLLLSEA